MPGTSQKRYSNTHYCLGVLSHRIKRRQMNCQTPAHTLTPNQSVLPVSHPPAGFPGPRPGQRQSEGTMPRPTTTNGHVPVRLGAPAPFTGPRQALETHGSWAPSLCFHSNSVPWTRRGGGLQTSLTCTVLPSHSPPLPEAIPSGSRPPRAPPPSLLNRPLRSRPFQRPAPFPPEPPLPAPRPLRKSGLRFHRLKLRESLLF